MHISWDDIQTIEALVRTGNVVEAAKGLSLRHSSVSRRIASIEDTLGAPLFTRGRRLVPTALARQIAEQAADMEDAARRVHALVMADRRAREERVVITTTDALAPLVLSTLSECLRQSHVQLNVSDKVMALEPGITDLAVRPSGQPSGALRGIRIGKLRLGVYRARSYPEDGEGWVLPSESMRQLPSMRWLRAVPRDATGAVECDSLLSMRDACVVGLGRAVLPVCLVADDPRMVHERDVSQGTPVWVLSSATRRADKRLQEVTRLVARHLKAVDGIWE